jgi:hypothetical protein
MDRVQNKPNNSVCNRMFIIYFLAADLPHIGKVPTAPILVWYNKDLENCEGMYILVVC